MVLYISFEGSGFEAILTLSDRVVLVVLFHSAKEGPYAGPITMI